LTIPILTDWEVDSLTRQRLYAAVTAAFPNTTKSKNSSLSPSSSTMPVSLPSLPSPSSTAPILLKNFFTPFYHNLPKTVESLYSTVCSTPSPLCAGYINCSLSLQKDAHNYPFWTFRCRGLWKNGSTLCCPSPSSAEYCFTKCPAQETECFNGEDSSCPNYDNTNSNEFDGPPIIVASEQVPVSTGFASVLQSWGIIALYTTFILAIGKLIRASSTGMAFQVVLNHMQDPTQILVLVHFIYLARAEGDLELEEKLFAELINLYRSPERIKSWTDVPLKPNEKLF